MFSDGPDTKYAVVGYCLGPSHTSNLSRTSSVVLFQGGPYPSHRVTDRAEDILKEKQTPYHLQLFSGVEHEFALGGDMFTHIKDHAVAAVASGYFRIFRLSIGLLKKFEDRDDFLRELKEGIWKENLERRAKTGTTAEASAF
ncbi:hypothetical protein EV421DRAFT_1740659 [Armillaria borealis]|uniref:Dienelactone hydrolase domain-containing protein n=1 Tax=Armillaria borealis TaxID=47425 RepID=A0AA39MH99_9AGAR|nr:hypothetical protein EV421DRAFT_1740659 [Armillaria borealis]